MVNTRSVSRATGNVGATTAAQTTAVQTTTGPAPPTTARWSHTPDAFTLVWLAISLPLVCWDTGYVMGRPHTMEGGALHWPLYVPYKLYGEIDHVYGWKAFNAGSGFTAAQGLLNLIETLMYLWYLRLTVGGGKKGADERTAATALLVGFSAAVMTLSKTVLYWSNEYYSGFDNIGHNSVTDLVFLWIIPNGAWLVGSTWMIYKMGGDIIDGITIASKGSKSE